MKQIIASTVMLLALVSCGETSKATSHPVPPPAVPNTPVVPVTINLPAKPSKWTDPDTGCQYLIFFGGYNSNSPAVTPRMRWNESIKDTRQMCGKE